MAPMMLSLNPPLLTPSVDDKLQTVTTEQSHMRMFKTWIYVKRLFIIQSKYSTALTVQKMEKWACRLLP
uniref:Uncharacterized protein n=1 Tax=Megaselia scalaris TaxID=36166 RepID=T1GY39_MEGSC